MKPRIAVIYHSRGGTMRALADNACATAARAGAQVRLRRVADDHCGGSVQWTEDAVVSADDVLWSDGLLFAVPTYFGNVSAPMKCFMDSLSPLWHQGLLADRAVAASSLSNSPQGGREMTVSSLHQTAHHWGSWVVRTERLIEAATYVRRAPVAGARLVIIHEGKPGSALHITAHAMAQGARGAGANVRLSLVSSVGAQDDLRWADAIAFGGHSALGLMSPDVLRFIIDSQGRYGRTVFAGKPVTAFTAVPEGVSGSQSALLNLYTALHHLDCVIVAPGYTDPSIKAADGNPYGISMLETSLPGETCLNAAQHQGRRLAEAAGKVRTGASSLRHATVPDPEAEHEA